MHGDATQPLVVIRLRGAVEESAAQVLRASGTTQVLLGDTHASHRWMRDLQVVTVAVWQNRAIAAGAP